MSFSQTNLPVLEQVETNSRSVTEGKSLLCWPSPEEREIQIANENKNDINYDDLKEKKIIDSGGDAVVYKATWNNMTIAIKEMTYSASAIREKRYLKKLTKLNAPNIIKFFGESSQAQKYCICMEYMPRGNLADFIDNYSISLNMSYRLMIDITIGVNFLHEQRILHRDIKSPNVLLTENYQAKLADFDLAIDENENQNEIAGTFRWMAPELLLNQKATRASDIYSTAITFWEIMSQYKPYSKFKSIGELANEVGKKKYREPTFYCPGGLADLVEAAWHHEPQKRPTAGELLIKLHLLAKQNNLDINNNNADIPQQKSLTNS